MKKNDNSSDAEILRQQAEERLKKKLADRGQLSEVDSLKLMHELEVHQIELEMLNEELLVSRTAAQEAAKKYLKLYDFAPIGYCTLSEQGKIKEINFYGAALLGKERLYLQGVLFGFFVSDDTLPIFKQFLDKVFNFRNTNETCVLTLQSKGNSTVFVHLTGVVSTNGEDCLVSLNDITKHKQAEDALRHSEQRWQFALEGAGDGVWDWNALTNEVFFSHRWKEMLGYNDDEIGHTLDEWSKRLHPDDSEKCYNDLNRHFEKETPYYQNEHRVQCKDGTYKWILDRGKVIEWNNDGKPLRVIGTHKDISERKQVEKALNESETRFKTLFERHSAVMMLIEPESGLILDVNDAASNFYGYSKSDMCCMNISEINMLPAEMVAQERKKAVNQKLNYFIFPHRIASGEERLVEVYSSPIDYLDNKVLFSVTHDITERKQSENNLKEVSARLQLATRAGGVGIWDYDVVNNVFVWDDQMFKLYGIDKNNFTGAYEAWLVGVHPEDKERGDSEIQMAISGVKDFNTEFRVVWQDGTVHFIRALAIVQKDDAGKPVKMTGTNWDISAQKNAEQSLRENEKDLREMNAEKDKLFSIISHDLRGPFNVFLNYTRMLEEDLSTMTHEQIRKFVHLMGLSATNLFRLLENLLEWSMLQRGLTTAHTESFLLMPNVKSSLDSVRDAATKKGIEISTDIPADLVVFADERMLDGIIRNLSTNAVKFTPKCGKVIIAAKPIPDGWVEISVKDTGIGMNKEIRDNLFKIGVDSNRKGTDREPSTGLGLILCKEFVEKQGGRLWVESADGKGSTFYFTIPMASEAESKAISQDIASDIKAHKQAKKLKVLIVEDDEASKMIFSISLTREGFEVLQAKTGVEAVEICREKPDIDLVLMDINLPEMDGLEATHQIRQFNKNVVIIAQTAYSNEVLGYGKNVADAGCNDYLLKPIDNNDLKWLIRKHFPV